jgi:uncharacterized membrane protein HdeD (DUF308 family)
MLLLALIDVAAAVVAIAYPGITTGALVIVIGVWAIFGGSMEIAATWNLRGIHSGSGWFTVGGLMSIFVGVLLIAWPNIGAVSLALVFGIYLLAYGVTLLVGAAVAPKARDLGSAFA